jgi:outer membrane beta-barrel protein
MKKYLWILVLAAGLSVSSGARAASSTPTLADDIESLQVDDQAQVSSVSTEKLYSFQTRYAPLTSRSEFTFTGGRNFTGDSFLATNQLGLGYRFHFSDRFSAGVEGSFVFNKLTESADRLYESQRVLPDVAYVRQRADLTLAYNLFYGKIRPGIDSNVYFDQYIALGAGGVKLDSGTKPELVADIGFAFWLGKTGSLRLGFKDYYFQETRRLSQGYTHNITGYVGVGILLGGSSSQEGTAL